MSKKFTNLVVDALDEPREDANHGLVTDHDMNVMSLQFLIVSVFIIGMYACYGGADISGE